MGSPTRALSVGTGSGGEVVDSLTIASLGSAVGGKNRFSKWTLWMLKFC